MSDDLLLALTPVSPLIGGVVALALWLASRRKGTPPYVSFWLDAAALMAISAGMLTEWVLLCSTSVGAHSSLLGLGLALSTVARLIVPLANGALLAATFLSWNDGREPPSHALHPLWVVWTPSLVSVLIAVALLATDRSVVALCLLGVALVVASVALSGPRSMLREAPVEEAARSNVARRLAGGLKHAALAAVGTCLLLAGAVLLDRYNLNLEKRTLLQLGLNLLAIGVMVRAGAAPFSAAAGDLIESAPGVAVVMLGAAAPAVLIAGLLMLAPLEGTLVNASAASWLGAVTALFAGLRALGAGEQVSRTKDDEQAGSENAATVPVRSYPASALLSMTVALEMGWILFGVLSGSRSGGEGAVLLAANLTLSVPLLVVSGTPGLLPGFWSRAGLLVGAASMLGLPPLGGFAGTLLVAESAANDSGFWLALLLLGSLLVALGWARFASGSRSGEEAGGARGSALRLMHLPSLLLIVLVLAQLALFFASGPLATAISSALSVPWLSAP